MYLHSTPLRFIHTYRFCHLLAFSYSYLIAIFELKCVSNAFVLELNQQKHISIQYNKKFDYYTIKNVVTAKLALVNRYCCYSYTTPIFYYEFRTARAIRKLLTILYLCLPQYMCVCMHILDNGTQETSKWIQIKNEKGLRKYGRMKDEIRTQNINGFCFIRTKKNNGRNNEKEINKKN